MIKENKKIIFLLILIIILICFDQISKIIILNHFGTQLYGYSSPTTIEVLGSFIQFQYVANEGMAMGLNFLPQFTLSLFSIIASIFLTYFLFKIKKNSIWICLGVALILSGAVGNLIDRVFYDIIFTDGGLFSGKVIDFIKVDIPDISIFGKEYTHWPIFNIADSCVTIGVIILLINYKKIPSFNDIFPSKNKKQDISPE